MTVAELILELQYQPQDLEVIITLPNGKQLNITEISFACPELADPYILLSAEIIGSN